ncbi:MAG: rhomboid family intramembrane serine protease [Planctomycetes bacterium]|nr:rhomboid family intramembrane serine protease [Planctomycetota bacterium]
MSFFDRGYYSDNSSFGQPKPKATYAILITMGIGIVLYIMLVRAAPNVVKQLILIPKSVIDDFKIWQLLTYGIFHNINSPFHLLINALMFWWIGKSVNLIMGNKRYLILVLTSVFFGGMFYCGWAMTGISSGAMQPVVGASAGVYGVLGYFCTRYANENITLVIPPVSFKAKWLLIFFVGIDVIFAFVPSGTGTAHMAHIGGAVIGIMWVKIITKRIAQTSHDGFSSSTFYDDPVEKKSFLDKRREKKAEVKKQKQTMKKQELKEQVDALLDKIKENGLTSLTEPERDFLRKSSEKYKSD